MNWLSNYKGFLLIFLSTVMFGSYGMWSRLIGDSMGVFYPSWTRSLIISIVLIPFLVYGQSIVPIQKKDWKWTGIFLAATSLTQAPLFYAFNHMDMGTATLLFFVTMLLTMYGAGISFLNEKITPIKIISFVVACAGLVVTFQFSMVTFSIIAALMACINGIASGSEVAFSKKLSGNYSSLYLIWLSWVVITVTNALISLVIGEVQYVPAWSPYWIYQCAYAVAGILGFWLVIEGMKYVEASTGGLLGLLEIIFSLMFGYLVFRQGMSFQVLLGGFLILVAAALPHLVEVFNKKTEGSEFTQNFGDF